MKKYWHRWKVSAVLIASLFSVNAVSGDLTRARISLVYYKDFPAQTIKNNVPVPGCILKMNSDKSGRVLWHCLERTYLIRPLSQFALLRQKQHRLKFNSAAFNLNHTNTRIVSVHLLKKPPILSDNGYVPVTGIFVTHSFKVRQYQFKNTETGHISNIRATWDHPFYTEDSGSFLPVSMVSSANHLINNKHEILQLSCPASCTTHCGAMVSRSLPAQVYNLETDKKHTFFAGAENIFVHNCDGHRHFAVLLNNHITYETERAGAKIEGDERVLYEGGVESLHKHSASQLLSNVDGEREIIRSKVAFYAMTGVHNNNSPFGVLFKDTGRSKSINESLEALSSEEAVEMMQQAPEYAEAETVFIINNAPAEEEAAVSRGFTEYFQAIGKLSGKKVIYNRWNSLGLSTVTVPGHASVLTRVVGHEAKGSNITAMVDMFPFAHNRFVLVRPFE